MTGRDVIRCDVTGGYTGEEHTEWWGGQGGREEVTLHQGHGGEDGVEGRVALGELAVGEGSVGGLELLQ